jgi:hypothetical protein
MQQMKQLTREEALMLRHEIDTTHGLCAEDTQHSLDNMRAEAAAAEKNHASTIAKLRADAAAAEKTYNATVAELRATVAALRAEAAAAEAQQQPLQPIASPPSQAPPQPLLLPVHEEAPSTLPTSSLQPPLPANKAREDQLVHGARVRRRHSNTKEGGKCALCSHCPSEFAPHRCRYAFGGRGRCYAASQTRRRAGSTADWGSSQNSSSARGELAAQRCG